MAKKGLCSICGSGGPLTEEHIPPECSGNLHDVTVFSGKDWLDADQNLEAMENGKPRPRGTFWATLCRRCNVDVLGSLYVPHFCDFVNRSRQVLATSDVVTRRDVLRSGPAPTVTLKGRVRPLAVVKTIAGMILAMNGEDNPAFREQNEALASFVLERDALLPEPYRAYVAVHAADTAVFAPVMASVSANGRQAVYSAVEYPPFAYVLTLHESDPYNRPFLPIGGLANFAAAPYELVADFELDLLVSYREAPIPGFYGE
jgi:hypothetical protein